MTRYAPRLAASAPCCPAASLAVDCPAAGREPASPGRAAGLLARLGQALAARRRRLPRLLIDELSAHRLRDLGLIDGRSRPPRQPWR